MTGIFPFQTIKCSLLPKTRTLKISPADTSFRPNQEQLHEWEMLFDWLATRTEIKSVLIQGGQDNFCDGPDDDLLAECEPEHLRRLLFRYQKLIFSSYFLPQTMVLDLSCGVDGPGAEFAFMGDIRIINENAEIKFDFLKRGICPTPTVASILTELVGQAKVRKWLFGPWNPSVNELADCGFVSESYSDDLDREKKIAGILEHISEQSPVCRIQARLMMIEPIMERMKLWTSEESTTMGAAIIVEDWKEFIRSHRAGRQPSFTNPVDLALKLSESQIS